MSEAGQDKATQGENAPTSQAPIFKPQYRFAVVLAVAYVVWLIALTIISAMR